MLHLHLAGGAVGEGDGCAAGVEALDHGGGDGFAQVVVGCLQAPASGNAAAVAFEVLHGPGRGWRP